MNHATALAVLFWFTALAGSTPFGHTSEHYLKHTLAWQVRGGPPRIEWSPVTITKSLPGVRAYGAAGEAKENAHA